MKYSTLLLCGLLSWMTTATLTARDSLDQKAVFPAGISVEYGIGSYAVVDEYISKEKYSGSLPYYRVGFANNHEGYVYQLGIEFRSASTVRNNNVSAEVYHFALNQGFLYRLPDFSLFSMAATAYVGPSTEIFIYFNKQNIAVSGFDYAQSFAGLFSLGLSTGLLCPVSGGLRIEASLNLSVLSLGWRMVDMEETDASPVKVLTLLSGAHGSFRAGMRYYVLHNLSVSASYLFDVIRISSWDPLRAASDNVVFVVTYGF